MATLTFTVTVDFDFNNLALLAADHDATVTFAPVPGTATFRVTLEIADRGTALGVADGLRRAGYQVTVA